MNTAKHIIVSCWAVFAVFWTVSAFSAKPVQERQPVAGRLAYVMLLACAAGLIAGRLGGASRRIIPHTEEIALLSDLLAISGLVICLWARVILGGNWSARVTFKTGHELIQSGPYRLVRHPIYSGLLLMGLGTVLLVGTLGGFFGLALFFAGLWVKLQQEEILLSRHFPSYPEYQRRTKALVPFVL